MGSEAEPRENLLETYTREVASKLPAQTITDFDASDDLSEITPHLISVPDGRKVHDLTKNHLDQLQLFRPLRRKGTASVLALESLIDWANRFKGATTTLFVDTNRSAPKMTCVANYHSGGAPVPGAMDPSASYNDHRATYSFPLSKEWKLWKALADQWLSMEEFSALIEERIADFMEPSGILLDGKAAKEDWEIPFVELAAKLLGRFGQPYNLVHMGREFEINETSDMSVKRNPDTGEAQVSFVNTQTDASGKPLKIPTLYLIAIPVFDRGDLFRMAVRLRYRKQGPSVVFNLAPHNPDLAFDTALQEAVDKAVTETKLPVFYGAPES